MNKPLLKCGALTAQPEHPSDWNVSVDYSIAENTSLNGTTTKDVMYRKYIYTLEWEAMTKADYEELETLINYHNDSAENIDFVYTKWASSATTIEVTSLPLSRAKKLGSGSTEYYQSVTLTLKEVDKR
jgi:hypothetical protein